MQSCRIFESRKFIISGLAVAVLLTAVSGVQARTTTITSLPYTAAQAGTNYSETLLVAGTKLTSASSGINFTGHDIVLNLGGDTIYFGTSGTASNGLTFSNGNRIRIEGGWVIHGITNDIGSNGTTGIKFSGSPHDILIHDTNVKVTGDNAHCVDSYGNGTGIYNIEISGGQYWSYCRRYLSRCNYDGAAIRFESGSPNGSYQARVHGIKLRTGPGQGIIGLGRLGSLGRYQIYACSLSTDHRNDSYPYDDGNVCHNSANPYLIHLRFVGAGTSIHDNVLRSGTTYGGSRGIMIENGAGTPSGYVEVYNNDCDTHEGPNVHYGEDFSNFGLRLRPIDGGEIKYVWVHDNKFIVRGDTLDSTDDYGSQPVGGAYSNDIPNNRHVIIERNLFKGISAIPGGVNSRAFMFDGAEADTTFVFRYNRLESDLIIFKFGDYNFGADNLSLAQDTLKFYSPVEANAETYHVGHMGNNWSCVGGRMIDMIYEGGASDTNIVFADGGSLDLALVRTLSVRVMGRNGLPVGGATVTATNHYNRMVLSGVTNDNGMIQGPVKYWYESRTSSDSTAFNNFTIKARRTSDSTIITYNVNWSCPVANVTLNNTDGQQPGGNDVIPPAAIQDLGAAPGDGHGQIDLGWTAPGDDGQQGLARGYDIRYSSVPITEDNWSSLPMVQNPPSPLEGGFFQQFALEGLNPGGQFYLALKTYDDANNYSALSNVVQSFASGVLTPTPLNSIVNEQNGTVALWALAVPSYLPLFYDFALDTTGNFSHPRIHVAIMADTAASVVFDSLVSGITYHWRCRAMASNYSDSSSWSNAITFNITTGVIMLLTKDDCLSPAEGAMVQTRKPNFTVRSVPNVENVYIQVADNSGFMSPANSGALATRAGQPTQWIYNGNLPVSGTYFWRISSDNSFWTSPVSFAANIDIHPYPNPFRVSEGHQGITFTNLPGKCRIDIATVSGEIVREAGSVGPDEWTWDVKNDSGKDVSSGVYLYVVEFENGSASGKVMILR